VFSGCYDSGGDSSYVVTFYVNDSLMGPFLRTSGRLVKTSESRRKVKSTLFTTGITVSRSSLEEINFHAQEINVTQTTLLGSGENSVKTYAVKFSTDSDPTSMAVGEFTQKIGESGEKTVRPLECYRSVFNATLRMAKYL